MIQKCPHCKRDVVFSREICPACGFLSREGERGEATYMGEPARLGLAPAYIEEMETRLNATQSRGRLMTSLVSGMLIAPLLVFFLVRLFWLRPTFLGLLALVAVSWVCWRFWYGSRPARGALIAYATIGGLTGLVTCVVKPGELDPVRFLAFLIFGAVYVWCAWVLIRSLDIPEWLSYQRERQRQEWG